MKLKLLSTQYIYVQTLDLQIGVGTMCGWNDPWTKCFAQLKHRC